MREKLKNIADIFTGQTFRSKVENEPGGEVWVIQMKDLDKNYSRISTEPNAIGIDGVSSKQLLRKGDVLFLSKGNNNVAFTYEDVHPAVAVSLFFIIRLKSQAIVPGYLTWFLNSPETQKFFISMREGASVSSIKKSIFEELYIEIPELKKQKLIAEIYKLYIRENELEESLVAVRRQFIHLQLTNSI
jgi:restriction endonuclease S subunit